MVIDFLLMVELCSQRGAVAVRQPYIRVVGIEEINEASSRGHAAFTVEEVQVEITTYNCFNNFQHTFLLLMIDSPLLFSCMTGFCTYFLKNLVRVLDA